MLLHMIIRLQYGGKPFSIPIHYNHLIQAYIYRIMGPYAPFVHDIGFRKGKKQFKLFVFSRLFGNFRRQGEFLHYTPPVSLYVATPLDNLGKSMMVGAAGRGIVDGLHLERMEVISPEISTNEAHLKTLSPIAVRIKEGGKHIYLSPEDERFKTLLEENLRDKFEAVFTTRYRGEIHIRIEKWKKRVINFKGIPVEAYDSALFIRASQKMIGLAMEAGLGARNSQGFGMVLAGGMFR